MRNLQAKPPPVQRVAHRSRERVPVVSLRSTAGSLRSWLRDPTHSAGLLFALVIGLSGLAWVALQAPTYTASTTVVVVPRSGASVADYASLFDSLSRGQVVATAADLLGEDRWHPETPEVAVSAGGVVPSSLIEIVARSEDPDAARSTAREVVVRATPRINEVLAPYVVLQVDPKVSGPTRVGLSRLVLSGVAVLAGVVCGFAAAALIRLMRS